MKRQELFDRSTATNVNDRVLRSLLKNHVIDANAEIIPNDLENQIISQASDQSGQTSEQSQPKAPQLNQSAPQNVAEELAQINNQTIILNGLPNQMVKIPGF